MPEEIKHHTTGRSHRGCGVRFTHLSSHYMGMDSFVQAVRPDLPWIDPLEARESFPTGSD